MHEWSEEEIVLVSAIEHYSYCPRQFALIYIENVFDENIYTLRGARVHERVDENTHAVEEGMRVERGLPIWSHRLGLRGKADLVEFHSDGTIYPVEYKSGSRRNKLHDNLQLCAQALCLEEMLGVTVNSGAIFYYSSRRRHEVHFDACLRSQTEQVIVDVRRLQLGGTLPPPVNDARCPNCSLVEACVPNFATAVRTFMDHIFIPIPEEEICEPRTS